MTANGLLISLATHTAKTKQEIGVQMGRSPNGKFGVIFRKEIPVVISPHERYVLKKSLTFFYGAPMVFLTTSISSSGSKGFLRVATAFLIAYSPKASPVITITGVSL